jgi:diaminohydroxyphosphoribosylaminopyrimidine deaminase/5-amino-6-(5-phosphoribosylamino)uracil reductase
MKTLTTHQLTGAFDGWAAYMQRALDLAANVFNTAPNPRVGCLIVKDNEIVGEGWHSGPGQNHAEIEALDRAGPRANSATAFVTLEPCAHTGKTGPCSKALIAAGIDSVVIASLDPDKRVSGQGVVDLEAANIGVFHLLDFDELAKRVNPGYFKRQKLGMPFVRLKLATSLDGRTALANGESRWITSSEARCEVQRYRAGSSAIITGINTVLIDNPTLTVRIDELQLDKYQLENNKISFLKKPLRVVVDTEKRTPDTSKIIHSEGKVKIFTAKGGKDTVKFAENVELVQMKDVQGRVDLRTMLESLATKFGCNDVLVEAGSTLSTSFINEGLVDELIIYIAPKILGRDARPLTEISGLTKMDECLQFSVKEVVKVGADIKVTLLVN